jgi:dolichol kinase
MDGVLARANCLLITTLWTAFKFVMVPLGLFLASRFPPEQFAVLFVMIWGSYIAADAMAEVGGALYGRQTLRVWGVGDVNRKSVGGTLTGFAASLVVCAGVVLAIGLPPSWMALALVISISNSLLELFSPRGTDDFTMATANALICCAFGLLIAA